MTNSSLVSNIYEDADSALYDDFFNSSMYNPEWIHELIFNYHFILIVAFIIFIFAFLTCLFGIVGNGVVIWLLGFCMKRNPFTTYILNLAIADIGVLICSILGSIIISIALCSDMHPFSPLGFYIFACAYSLLYITDQLLLTAISVDRCVAVLFPVWHRCHRPPRLSGIVCVFIWVLSFLLSGSDMLLTLANQSMLLEFVVNVAICTPLMAVSTVVLFVKICTKSQQRKRGKLLMVIFLALFLFLMFGSPVNYCYVLTYYYILDDTEGTSLFHVRMIIIPAMAAFACTVLNCSVNPLIYFLVGRKKKGRFRLSMKVAFQRVFKEEENCRGQEGLQAETEF
uniref:mas-related G-protein coupled receptor member H-like n=1 Tax=Euleptes europaea TaxID=460621 RepID=UPI00254049FD|nr:mas-related G-protein coupled receptor member H-like [Euleptes europaea]